MFSRVIGRKGGGGVTFEGRLSCGEIRLSVEWFKCAAGLIHSVHQLQHHTRLCNLVVGDISFPSERCVQLDKRGDGIAVGIQESFCALQSGNTYLTLGS